MRDEQILALFDRHSEDALRMVEEDYGAYCRKIAGDILDRPEDVEECIQDTLHRAWRSIPGNHPRCLRSYLAAVARNLAVNKYRSVTAQKRGGRSALLLEELSECLSDQVSAEDQVLKKELGEAVNRFLRGLPGRERDIFLRRYFYAESVSEISERYLLREAAVYTSLSRTRKKLRKYLRKEGYLE